MNRTLKNPIRQHIVGDFRGKKITFKSKASKTFNMDDEEQKAEYFYWKEVYDFIYDITPEEVSKL